MKVIPSTYHQVLKFFTEHSMRTIKEEQKQSKECYFNALNEKTSQDKEHEREYEDIKKPSPKNIIRMCAHKPSTRGLGPRKSLPKH